MHELLTDSLFFGSLLTLACYEVGLMLKKRFKLAILNPILIATLCIIAVLTLADVEFAAYNQSAERISFLLTPATVCLAVPLYEQLSLLKKNLKAVAAGLVAGVLTGLVCILLLSLLFKLPHEIYVSLLPKSITTAIGMGVSAELGGVVPLTVPAIVLTGVLGAVIAEPVFKLFRIHEPVARGLGIGTASHAIGTSKAMELGQVEGAMSSLAIVVAGLLTVILAPLLAGLA